MGNDPKNPESTGGEIANAAPFKITAEPQIASRVETPSTSESASLPTKNPSPAAVSSVYENLGTLPATYQTGHVFLAARDPHWLFVYWDIDLEGYDRKMMVEDDVTFYLKVYTTNSELTDQIRVNPQAKSWYFPVKDAGVSYYVELGFNDSAYKWAVIGKSNVAFAPSDSFTEGLAEFASVPFHLSFDRMLEMVQAQMDTGKSLVGSLASLQGDAAKNLREIANSWTDEQRKLLETLVGEDLVAQISLGSGEVDQIFRKRLSEALSHSLMSPTSSEIFFLQNLAGSAFSESSLFSGVGAGWSAETSWTSAVGGETSWSAALGSSWSAQPFGVANREFFMHVNAEVIFYGGTHPDATVWIDGQQINLAADGSFRYHFKLPDGEFEIPIVAESPDGVEIRSAKLVFKRGTTRSGEVGHTDQPGYLNAPMGSR